MKRCPPSGSCPKTSRTIIMRLSAPLRPSTGCVATKSRTLGGRLSTTMATTAPAPRPSEGASRDRSTRPRGAHGPNAGRPRRARRRVAGTRRTRARAPAPARTRTSGASYAAAGRRTRRGPRTRPHSGPTTRKPRARRGPGPRSSGEPSNTRRPAATSASSNPLLACVPPQAGGSRYALRGRVTEHQPLERQATRFQRAGVDVAPQTLSRGVEAAIDLLTPVATLIQVQTRAPGLLGTDASSIPILDPGVPAGIRSGAMWCWTNARWVTFFYSPSGDSDSVRRFLGEDLARTVQCDGTSVTTFLERVGGRRPGCWSHGRRRLVEAARSGGAVALEGLHIIARLFAVERASKLAGDSAEERRARRDQHTRPVLAELRDWLDDKRDVTPPKTPLGHALGYLHRQWQRLILFLDDGNIEATNNRRERELRRLVLGRKNWLFTWLDLGGERTGAILSTIATCIAH